MQVSFSGDRERKIRMIARRQGITPRQLLLSWIDPAIEANTPQYTLEDFGLGTEIRDDSSDENNFGGFASI